MLVNLKIKGIVLLLSKALIWVHLKLSLSLSKYINQKYLLPLILNKLVIKSTITIYQVLIILLLQQQKSNKLILFPFR